MHSFSKTNLHRCIQAERDAAPADEHAQFKAAGRALILFFEHPDFIDRYGEAAAQAMVEAVGPAIDRYDAQVAAAAAGDVLDLEVQIEDLLITPCLAQRAVFLREAEKERVHVVAQAHATGSAKPYSKNDAVFVVGLPEVGTPAAVADPEHWALHAGNDARLALSSDVHDPVQKIFEAGPHSVSTIFRTPGTWRPWAAAVDHNEAAVLDHLCAQIGQWHIGVALPRRRLFIRDLAGIGPTEPLNPAHHSMDKLHAVADRLANMTAAAVGELEKIYHLTHKNTGAPADVLADIHPNLRTMLRAAPPAMVANTDAAADRMILHLAGIEPGNSLTLEACQAAVTALQGKTADQVRAMHAALEVLYDGVNSRAAGDGADGNAWALLRNAIKGVHNANANQLFHGADGNARADRLIRLWAGVPARPVTAITIEMCHAAVAVLATKTKAAVYLEYQRAARQDQVDGLYLADDGKPRIVGSGTDDGALCDMREQARTCLGLATPLTVELQIRVDWFILVLAGAPAGATLTIKHLTDAGTKMADMADADLQRQFRFYQCVQHTSGGVFPHAEAMKLLIVEVRKVHNDLDSDKAAERMIWHLAETVYDAAGEIAPENWTKAVGKLTAMKDVQLRQRHRMLGVVQQDSGTPLGVGDGFTGEDAWNRARILVETRLGVGIQNRAVRMMAIAAGLAIDFDFLAGGGAGGLQKAAGAYALVDPDVLLQKERWLSLVRRDDGAARTVGNGADGQALQAVRDRVKSLMGAATLSDAKTLRLIRAVSGRVALDGGPSGDQLKRAVLRLAEMTVEQMLAVDAAINVVCHGAGHARGGPQNRLRDHVKNLDADLNNNEKALRIVRYLAGNTPCQGACNQEKLQKSAMALAAMDVEAVKTLDSYLELVLVADGSYKTVGDGDNDAIANTI